jgi:hemerythrin
MTFVKWSDTIRIGVAAFDAEHMRLLAMMNDLYEALMSENVGEALGGVLQGLVAYGETHMRHEESVFAETGYPKGREHTAQHDEFRRRVGEMRKTAPTRDGMLAALETMAFLKDWLMRHIMMSDREYGAYLNAKGIR